MNWKGLLSFFLGMICIGVSGLQAQESSDRTTATTISSRPMDDCSSLQDVVDREICAARQAIAAADEALGKKGLTTELAAHWRQIRQAQLAKVDRLEAMSPTDRKKMQAVAAQAEQARQAAPTR
ncbi:MAG: hypothetical protein H6568_06080 [Lewinellaceae bacterium]|nr:hypothetical protein [Lewinellaceae bacterium]HRW76633.1 hypothetical protein [Saprospiraceae bacterium]